MPVLLRGPPGIHLQHVQLSLDDEVTDHADSQLSLIFLERMDEVSVPINKVCNYTKQVIVFSIFPSPAYVRVEY